MDLSPQRKIAYSFAFISIAIPVLVMFLDLQVGVILFLAGIIIAYRAIRFGAQSDVENTDQQLSRHQDDRGQTIFVQIVDEFGRDLPPAVAQKLIADAQAKASPRDTVVGVRYKITDK